MLSSRSRPAPHRGRTNEAREGMLYAGPTHMHRAHMNQGSNQICSLLSTHQPSKFNQVTGHRCSKCSSSHPLDLESVQLIITFLLLLLVVSESASVSGVWWVIILILKSLRHALLVGLDSCGRDSPPTAHHLPFLKSWLS